jgi:uncharacterized protein
MKTIHWLTAALVVVGALNWGFVAVARFDLVAAVFGMQFGEVNGLSAIVYALVGLSGVYQAVTMMTAPRQLTQATVRASR